MKYKGFTIKTFRNYKDKEGIIWYCKILKGKNALHDCLFETQKNWKTEEEAREYAKSLIDSNTVSILNKYKNDK